MLYIISPIDVNLVASEIHQVVKRNCCILKVVSVKKNFKKNLDQYNRYNETWNPKYYITQVTYKNMCFEM